MNDAFLDILDKTVEPLLRWETAPIFLPLSTDLQSGAVQINVINTLGEGINTLPIRKKRERYWFLPTIVEQEDLANMITNICITKGFSVAVSFSATPKRKHKVADKKIVISCC